MALMRMMNPLNADKTALERAFEIARAGYCHSIEDIRRQLQHEGYNQYQIQGPVLGRQLSELARRARASSPD
jgi:hypothetical protein